MLNDWQPMTAGRVQLQRYSCAS